VGVIKIYNIVGSSVSRYSFSPPPPDLTDSSWDTGNESRCKHARTLVGARDDPRRACGAASLPLGHGVRMWMASEVRAHLEARLPTGVWAALGISAIPFFVSFFFSMLDGLGGVGVPPSY